MPNFTVGQTLLYTLMGLPAQVTKVHAEHHQVDLRLEDGREYQGVFYQYLQEMPKAPRPTSDVPPPATPAEPERPKYSNENDAPLTEANLSETRPDLPTRPYNDTYEDDDPSPPKRRGR